jgi:uncharacterized protein (DUF1501 family)
MRRREFLRLFGAVALVPLGSDLAFAAVPRADYRRLLVLIELKGGNDGVNTVIPYADKEYYRLRPRLGIARDQVLQLDEFTGLHPSMKALLPLWQSGQVAIVQGVGYPKPDLSHFRSIEIWDTASDSDEYLDQGWLTQLFVASPPPRRFAADGVLIGSQELGPLAGATTRAVALNNPEAFARQGRNIPAPAVRTDNPALAHLLKVEDDIRRAAADIGTDYAFRAEFPASGFGRNLKTAAQVVAASTGVAAIRVTLNGFDTHSNQLATQARLLTEIAEGLAAFKAALQEVGRWDSTLVMTYAEFGRRLHENGSAGTDHGTANAHFLVGGRVRGGLYGERPRLTQLENGNLRHAVDFRQLYAAVAERWWGLPGTGVLGGRFRPLDVVRA